MADVGVSISRMPGPPAGALVADDDDVACLDLAREDGLAGFLFGIEAAGGTRMREHRGVDSRLLHDAAVGGNVAVEHAQRTDLRERVVMCAAHLAIGGFRALLDILGKGAHAGKCGLVEKPQLVEPRA